MPGSFGAFRPRSLADASSIGRSYANLNGLTLEKHCHHAGIDETNLRNKRLHATWARCNAVSTALIADCAGRDTEVRGNLANPQPLMQIQLAQRFFWHGCGPKTRPPQQGTAAPQRGSNRGWATVVAPGKCNRAFAIDVTHANFLTRKLTASWHMATLSHNVYRG